VIGSVSVGMLPPVEVVSIKSKEDGTPEGASS
jgi:hypothetical protein